MGIWFYCNRWYSNVCNNSLVEVYMIDPEFDGKYQTPRWVKWSAWIGIILILLVVAHIFVGGMSQVHSMLSGG